MVFFFADLLDGYDREKHIFYDNLLCLLNLLLNFYVYYSYYLD